VHVEPDFGEKLKQKEEREEWERLVKKAAGEVGYLYFIGGGGVGIDHLAIWCEDFDQSNQYLVERNKAPNSETTGDEDVQEDWDDDMDVDEMGVDEA
jgi:hypothetical protein